MGAGSGAHHPSIVVWRFQSIAARTIWHVGTLWADFRRSLDAEVRNGLIRRNRPHADDTDIVAWGQSPDIKDNGRIFTTTAPLENAAKIQQPFLNIRDLRRISESAKDVEFFQRRIIKKSI